MKEWQKILSNQQIPEDNWEVQELKKMLSDHGSYLPLFFWFHVENNNSFLELSNLFNKIQTNKDILRNCAINPIEAYKPKLNAAKQYEILNDLIDLALIEHQQEKLAKSFISSKHMHLLNSENVQLI